MIRFLAAALLCAVAVLVPAPALAAEVTIPLGQMLTEAVQIAAGFLSWLIPLVAAFVMRHSRVAAMLFNLVGGERILREAIDYGVNAVAEAAKDRVLTVQVGSEVLAAALQYAVDNIPPSAIRALGGPDGIRRRLFAALHLEPDATAEALGVEPS